MPCNALCFTPICHVITSSAISFYALNPSNVFSQMLCRVYAKRMNVKRLVARYQFFIIATKNAIKSQIFLGHWKFDKLINILINVAIRSQIFIERPEIIPEVILKKVRGCAQLNLPLLTQS